MSDWFEQLRADYRHYRCGSFYNLGEAAPASSPGRLLKSLLDVDFRVVLLFRLSAALWRSGLRLPALLIHYRLKSRHHVEMHPSLQVGPGLRLVHGFCIVIGSETQIGRDVVIFGQTFLGKSRPDLPGSRMPRIGDHVLLGAGCKILGDVEIPSHTLVAANAVVTRSALRNNPGLLTPIDA